MAHKKDIEQAALLYSQLLTTRLVLFVSIPFILFISLILYGLLSLFFGLLLCVALAYAIVSTYIQSWVIKNRTRLIVRHQELQYIAIAALVLGIFVPPLLPTQLYAATGQAFFDDLITTLLWTGILGLPIATYIQLLRARQKDFKEVSGRKAPNKTWPAIVLTALFTVPLFTAALVNMPRGIGKDLNKFTGLERQVAEAALRATRVDGTDHIRDLPFVYLGASVREVYTGPPRTKQCRSYHPYTDDPNSIYHYGATVVWHTFFGLEYRRIDYHSCSVLGG